MRWTAWIGIIAFGLLVLTGSALAGEQQDDRVKFIEKALRGPLTKPELSALNRIGRSAPGSERLDVRGDVVAHAIAYESQREDAPRTSLKFHNLDVVGDIALRHRELPFELVFAGCHIDGRVNLENATVAGLAFVEKCEVRHLSAKWMTVHGSLLFRDESTATEGIELERARIDGELDMSTAHVHPMVADDLDDGTLAIHADGIVVGSGVNLRNIEAHGCVWLAGASVADQIQLEKARLDADSDTRKRALNLQAVKCQDIFLNKGCSITGMVSLTAANLRGALVCNDCTLKFPGQESRGQWAVHADSLTAPHVQFDRVDIEGTVRLYGATISEYFLWHKIKRPKEAVLAMRNAKLGRVVLDMDALPGQLTLAGWSYKVLDCLRGDARSASKCGVSDLKAILSAQTEFHSQPYEQVAKVLEGEGRAGEAKAILIAREEARSERTNMNGWHRFWHAAYGALVGYGHDPWRALVYAAIILVLGSVFFYVANKRGLMVGEEGATPFLAWAYSLDVFVPLVDLKLAKKWTPDPNAGGRWFGAITSGGTVRLWMWFQHLSGWVLTTLLATGLAGLVRG